MCGHSWPSREFWTGLPSFFLVSFIIHNILSELFHLFKFINSGFFEGFYISETCLLAGKMCSPKIFDLPAWGAPSASKASVATPTTPQRPSEHVTPLSLADWRGKTMVGKPCKQHMLYIVYTQRFSSRIFL